MPHRFLRWRSCSAGCGTVFAIALMGSLGSALAQTPPKAPYDAATLLEIRPAGGNVVGPGADLLAQSILERVRRVPGVVTAEAYLFVGVRDATKQASFAVIGGTAPGAAFRVNCHNVDAVNVVEGRGLEAQDAGQLTAMVGRRYAETYAPAGLVRIPVGGLIGLVGPGADMGNARIAPDAKVRVVGIFSAGFPLGDNQVLLPLDTAQKLFGLEGKISKVVVTVDAPAAKEKVTEALFTLLGDDVDVVSPLQGGMR
jgi:hypothetical protein